MISATLALVLIQASPAATEPPPGLQFGFFRMAAFRQRVKDLGCNRGQLDAELEDLRKRLAARYGKKAFSWPKIPNSGPGDCRSVEMVYRVNLVDFRKAVDTALAAPVAVQGE